MQAGFQQRFGHSFERVRVHADARAARSARAVNARAYTVGSNIVFGVGQYAPESMGGQRLLAHELAHVVQQSASTSALPSTLSIGAPHDTSEREATRAEGGALSGQPGTLSRVPAGVALLQRQGGGFPGSLNPSCTVDWQAVFQGNFDLTKHVNCCAKLPIVSNTCSKDVIDGIRNIKQLGKGGKKPSDPGQSKPNCPGRETPFDTCCPAGNAWNGAICAPPLPSEQTCLAEEKRSLFGGCCKPGALIDLQGRPCVLVPEPQKPQQPPVPALTPGPVEILFQLDRPRVGETGATALRTSATGDGLGNFESVVGTLLGNPALSVQLVGRASPEGTVEYNLSLGGRRAQVVAEALAATGVASSRISDPPTSDLKSDCQEIGPGLATCGESGSTGPRDRQVLVRFFTPATTGTP